MGITSVSYWGHVFCVDLGCASIDIRLYIMCYSYLVCVSLLVLFAFCLITEPVLNRVVIMGGVVTFRVIVIFSKRREMERPAASRKGREWSTLVDCGRP